MAVFILVFCFYFSALLMNIRSALTFKDPVLLSLKIMAKLLVAVTLNLYAD